MPNVWEDFPQRKDAHGRHLCKKCGNVLDGKKTAWCGKEFLKAVLFLVRWPVVRNFVRRRDKWTCQMCGRPGREVDHIVEVADGGLSVPENLWVLCHADHMAKTAASRKARAKRNGTAPSSPPVSS